MNGSSTDITITINYSAAMDSNYQCFDTFDGLTYTSEIGTDQQMKIIDTKAEWANLSENRRLWFIRWGITMREDGYFENETDLDLLRGLEIAGA
ncbi:hypothetical protein ACX3U9_08790 [Corynebacterium pyruviciproducens]|uniref:Uncharacterized protein n=2 Tax=Corynebacterium pyruviciproducens TaxID=598660 RepID=A0AAF0YQ39_9CORY|nr:hypothetical protein [Corynebacterium pyruviciproducens]MDK7215552.1 hypothetical protein [Corynebacterium pyruviciproducens]WOT01289.1 hypothetical protein CYJ47_08350 [Corynebacterium pyruviciproducens]